VVFHAKSRSVLGHLGSYKKTRGLAGKREKKGQTAVKGVIGCTMKSWTEIRGASDDETNATGVGDGIRSCLRPYHGGERGARGVKEESGGRLLAIAAARKGEKVRAIAIGYARNGRSIAEKVERRFHPREAKNTGKHLKRLKKKSPLSGGGVVLLDAETLKAQWH